MTSGPHIVSVFICPFHDDSRPSLRVNPEKNVCYCDVCARGGDGIWLVGEVLKTGFPEAVSFIAKLENLLMSN